MINLKRKSLIFFSFFEVLFKRDSGTAALSGYCKIFKSIISKPPSNSFCQQET